ncbi:MAG: hypothetical protein HY762_04210 [Planctomycetes bacterium]|nr:hypothetical protein [Planctomycetota bacterium]
MTNGKWQCEKCGRLLGIYKNGFVCIQIKNHQYTVEDGRVQAVCPNQHCHTLNIIRVKKDVA